MLTFHLIRTTPHRDDYGGIISVSAHSVPRVPVLALDHPSPLLHLAITMLALQRHRPLKSPGRLAVDSKPIALESLCKAQTSRSLSDLPRSLYQEVRGGAT